MSFEMTDAEATLAKFAWARLGKNQRAMLTAIDVNNGELPPKFRIGSANNMEVLIASLERNGMVSRDAGPRPRLTNVGWMVLRVAHRIGGAS